MSKVYDYIVIGGGHNGLTTASMLCKSGKSVLLLEQQNYLGGLAASRPLSGGGSTNGLLFDTSMVAEEVARQLKLDQVGLTRDPNIPRVCVPLSDGREIYLYSNVEKTVHSISQFSEKDGKAYREFQNFIARLRRPLKQLLHNPPPHFDKMSVGEKLSLLKSSISLRLLGKRDLFELLRVPPMCVADWLNEWFELPELKSALALDAVAHSNNGPWSPGSAFNLLINEIFRGPNVKGGPKALIEALSRRAEMAGVEKRLGNRVKQIVIKEQVAVGVLLESGEEIIGKKIISSCDPKTTFLNLVPSRNLTWRLEQQVKHFRSRGTTGIVNFIADSLDCKNHNKEGAPILRYVSGLDDLEKAFDAIKYGKIAENLGWDMHFEGKVATLSCHFVPYVEGAENLKIREKMLELAKSKIQQVTSASSLLTEEAFTPFDLEKEFGLYGGHLHHGELAVDQVVVRPFPDCAHYNSPIENLHICGSGTFPGGNLTCLPGYLAAKIL